MKEFKTLEEAKKWGESYFTSKRQYEQIKVDGKLVILCCTDLAYEDEVWNKAYELAILTAECFGFKPDKEDDELMDEASGIRDYTIELIEQLYECSVEAVFDEY